MAMFPITVDENRKIISKFKNKGNTSHDGISKEIIESCSPVIEPYLVELFNKCLNEKKFPDEMKTAKIVPFFKKKHRLQPQNYRAINPLSSITKIFESIICKRMTIFFSRRDLFSENQHGFRENRSCINAIVEITE